MPAADSATRAKRGDAAVLSLQLCALGVVMLGIVLSVYMLVPRAQVTRVQQIAHFPDVDEGLFRYLESCSQCHGARAEGMPRSGVTLRGSREIKIICEPIS